MALIHAQWYVYHADHASSAASFENGGEVALNKCNKSFLADKRKALAYLAVFFILRLPPSAAFTIALIDARSFNLCLLVKSDSIGFTLQCNAVTIVSLHAKRLLGLIWRHALALSRALRNRLVARRFLRLSGQASFRRWPLDGVALLLIIFDT